MNHLREVIDAPALGGVILDRRGNVVGNVPGAELSAVHAELRHYAERAVCFWLGDLDQMCELSPIPDLCRLPYPTCWFEAEMKVPDSSDRPLSGLLLTQDEGGAVHGVSVTRIGRGWQLDGVVHGPGMGMNEMEMSSVDDACLIQLRHMLYAAMAFLSALHCSNVKKAEHTVEPKLAKSRAQRGKAPLFSYWTLQLDGKSERGEDQGGTHASPRVHLRRGHPRQYAAGKWTWVQAHAVGNRTAGMVHKDYSVGPKLSSAA